VVLVGVAVVRAGRAAWLALLLAGCAVGTGIAPSPIATLPESASGWVDKPGWSMRRFAVAAAHPLAAQAGVEMLRAGGSALDAAVAVQMVLALVEPQSSGIGGGAFLLHWDGATVQAWDGRETAPAATGEDLFLQPDGQAMPLARATVGGRAVGVPGAVRMLEDAHRLHGKLPWARLFAPAIALAEQGFRMGPRLHALLIDEAELKRDPQARAYFYAPDGQPHPVGSRMRNPALAVTLRAIAERGSVALHEGAVADDIARRVQRHPHQPGRLTHADLAAYRSRLRAAICTDWRVVYRICGMPPPSSGHLAVMQILGMLEHAPDPGPALDVGLPTAGWLHRYTEAARLAYADRALYVADPDFVAPPAGDWRSLLDEDYLKRRAALIGPRQMVEARPGQPGPLPERQGLAPEQAEHGTSHVSVVDAEGRAVALTTSIEAAFGARLMSDGGSGLAGGFLLNNQLTDFSFVATDAEGAPIANRVQPGKRPRSSMSPTLVFDRRDGRLLMSLGSPGGGAIVHFTAKVLIGSLDWGLDVQRSIDLPNFASFNGPETWVEKGRFPAATLDALRGRGHRVVAIDLPSGLQAIQRTPGGWFGGADPRREGVVMGD
jgi:gamma-glutamyltranspeptidase/glutathione hydrolase